MNRDIQHHIIRITYSPEAEKAIARCRRKDTNLFQQVQSKILRIVNEPNIGKPLRYSLKNRRRIHVGSFVLVYEFRDGELRFLDFDHHDKIYKKQF